MNWQNKKINSTEEERNEKPISEPAGLFVTHTKTQHLAVVVIEDYQSKESKIQKNSKFDNREKFRTSVFKNNFNFLTDPFNFNDLKRRTKFR